MYILTFIEKLKNLDNSTWERVNTDKYTSLVKALDDFKRMENMKWITPIMIHGETTSALIHAPMFGKFAYRDRSEVVAEYKAKKAQAEIDKHVPGEMTELTSYSGEGKSFIEEQLKGEIDEFVGKPNNAETMKELQVKVKDTLDSLSYGFGADLDNPASFNGHGKIGEPGKKAPEMKVTVKKNRDTMDSSIEIPMDFRKAAAPGVGKSTFTDTMERLQELVEEGKVVFPSTEMGMPPHLSYGVPPIMDYFPKMPSPLTMTDEEFQKKVEGLSNSAKQGSGVGFYGLTEYKDSAGEPEAYKMNIPKPMELTEEELKQFAEGLRETEQAALDKVYKKPEEDKGE